MVRARCRNAELCLDPFHIVAWATKALDEVRREVWNAARRDGHKAVATGLKGARYALWKNPENLTQRQGTKLGAIWCSPVLMVTRPSAGACAAGVEDWQLSHEQSRVPPEARHLGLHDHLPRTVRYYAWSTKDLESDVALQPTRR